MPNSTPTAVAEADLVWIVIQEGGSSGEFYANVYDSEKEATEFRADCGKSAYRTSEPMAYARQDVTQALLDRLIADAADGNLELEYCEAPDAVELAPAPFLLEPQARALNEAFTLLCEAGALVAVGAEFDRASIQRDSCHVHFFFGECVTLAADGKFEVHKSQEAFAKAYAVEEVADVHKAIGMLKTALAKATKAGALDALQGLCHSPDSIKDVCDAVELYFSQEAAPTARSA